MDISALGKTPIKAEAPCGAEARYEPEYESVQTEIDKLSSPTASGQVAWDRIVENAAVVLEKKSKDLTIAGYLAVALVITRQIDGLDQGVAVLHDLLTTYWEGLYPNLKRMRGRAAALQWWLERTETELQKLSPAPLPAEQVARIKANLAAIDALLAEKMPDAPMLRPLQRRVEALPVQAEVQVPAPAPASAPAPTTASAAPAAAAPPGGTQPAAPAPTSPPAEKAADDPLNAPIGDETQAGRAADAAFQRLRQTSLFLLQHDLKNPLSYRYRRIAGWAKVTSLPPHKDGATQLVPPPPPVAEALCAQRDQGQLEALIQNAEQKFSQYIFWLDLNRYVAEALGDLGSGCEAARRAVCQETAAFLERYPDLATLRFSDGTAFADPQTKGWLKRLRPAGPEGGEAAAGPTAGSAAGTAADPIAAALEQARALARKKELAAAVALLQQPMQQSAGQSSKLRWRLAIVELLLEAKKAPMALPHLERVLADIDTFRLEQWDPALALEGFTIAWQGFSAAGGEGKGRAAGLLQRIAVIDPAGALQLGG